MPGGAGRAAAQGPWGPSVRTPAAGHSVGPGCPLPQHRAPTPGSGRSRAAGCLAGRRSASGAPQRPGPPSLPVRVARGPGRGCRGAHRRHLKQPGYAGPAGRRSPERSGGRTVLEGSLPPPPPLVPPGAERRHKKGREPGSAERAPRSALSAARAPSPAPHAPARAPRPPAPLSTPAPHTGAQPAGQTTGTPTPTAPPPRGASC